jgi:hypothetical protein
VFRLFLVLFALSFCSNVAPAAEIRPIRFASGASSAVVSDAVVRGTRHVFSLDVRKGQSGTIAVTSTEQNAAISVWRPGAKVTFADSVDVEGKLLPGAEEEADAVEWRGVFPESGVYIIVVGPTRGNATYKLSVRVGK